jgi:hypothetical protein
MRKPQGLPSRRSSASVISSDIALAKPAKGGQWMKTNAKIATG